MRKTVRLFSAVGPTQRLGEAITVLPAAVQRALADVADRTDLALAAGSWHDGQGGCLVANVVACVSSADDRGDSDGGLVAGAARTVTGVDGAERTLDLRMLDAFPQMSSRDLNVLICAWDEAAAQAAASTDGELRTLLRNGLALAGMGAGAPPSGGGRDGADVRTRADSAAL